jgi:hypothetical protein
MGPLQHRRMRRAVAAHVDGELDASGGGAVATHLRECWSCSGDAELLMLIKRSLRKRRDRDALAVLRLRRFVARVTD